MRLSPEARECLTVIRDSLDAELELHFHECHPKYHSQYMESGQLFRCSCGKRWRSSYFFGGYVWSKASWFDRKEFHHEDREDCCRYTRTWAALRNRVYKPRKGDQV